MTEPDVYLLGRGLSEEERLKRQIADLAPEADLKIDSLRARLRGKDGGCGGLTDINVDAVVHVHPVGHSRRPIFRDFVNNVRDGLIDGGFISRDDLERDLGGFEQKLADPEVLATSSLYYRLWGRVPAGGVN
jgi:hypothetical protein